MPSSQHLAVSDCGSKWLLMIPVFRHSCFCIPFPLYVGGPSWLAVVSHDGMSLPWLGNKRLTSVLLADSIFFLAGMLWWCQLPRGRGHVAKKRGQTLSNSQWRTKALSPSTLEEVMLPTTTESAEKQMLPHLRLQTRLQTLGWHLDGSLVRDSEAEDPARLFPDSSHSETEIMHVCCFKPLSFAAIDN